MDKSERDRRSPKYAAEVFGRLCGDENVKGCAAWFARAIQTATAVGGAWAVTLHDDNVLLNVGPVRLLNLSEHGLWFVAKRFEDTLPSWVVEYTAERGDRPVYKSVPVSTRDFHVEAARLDELPPFVLEAFLAYVSEAAARRRGKSAFIRSHSPGVVAYLADVLARPLPQPPGAAADELDDEEPRDDVPVEVTYLEGKEAVVMTTRRSRKSAARAASIAARGVRCTVCGMSFGELYGEMGEGFIHVHHLEPLAAAMGERAVRADDLVPICPNCHCMLHRKDPPLTPDELADRMRHARASKDD